MINEWNLTETNLSRLRDSLPEVAVIGTGAIEAHNLHLPEGQDFLHTSHIVNKVTRIAWEKTQSVICLPLIPYGVDCNLLNYPLTIHIEQITLDLIIKNIAASLVNHGIRKIVLINGHGGNSFSALTRQIQHDLDVYFFVCNWYEVGMDQYDTIFQKPDDHAGELETSVALELFPELVEIDNALDGKTRPFQFEALREGWVKTSRDFSKLNDHCATADAIFATAEKGKKYLSIVYERISNFLIELAEAPLHEFFPHNRDFLDAEFKL